MEYVVKASYGNDSVALIQWMYERALEDVVVLYNDTGWAADGWNERVTELEKWARGLGFQTDRTQSIGLEALVRKRKGWPRQGIQFCTKELKIDPTLAWKRIHDPDNLSTSVIGIKNCDSTARSNFPEFSVDSTGWQTWAPLVRHTESMRNSLLERAGVRVLPFRSKECFPCINSNRSDILFLAHYPERIDKIERIETDMGYTSKGNPRTMFRPYRYMGATGIKEIVRWAQSPRGKFELDDGNNSPGCEAGWCGL